MPARKTGWLSPAAVGRRLLRLLAAGRLRLLPGRCARLARPSDASAAPAATKSDAHPHDLRS